MEVKIGRVLFSERKYERKILKSLFNGFDDFIALFYIIIFEIYRIFYILEPYEDKTSYTFLGGVSISIPKGCLSNCCKECSTPKRGKRSSESGSYKE